ncbi:hypothetical protein GD416_10920 [Burkholderia sp. BE24]|nr:hypothetical protein [Burkholderia sp. BE24]
MGHGYPEWKPARIGARVTVKTGCRAARGAFRPMIVRATFSPASDYRAAVDVPIIHLTNSFHRRERCSHNRNPGCL